MATSSGEFTYFQDVQYSATKYEVERLAQKYLPQRGRFIDWAYAAGWDREEGTGFVAECEPFTYELSNDNINFGGSGQ